MRELYLRPFEIAVKEGHTTAVMSSFNRIGTRWTGGDLSSAADSKSCGTNGGFQGMVITDFNTTSYMNLLATGIMQGGALEIGATNNDAAGRYSAELVRRIRPGGHAESFANA